MDMKTGAAEVMRDSGTFAWPEDDNDAERRRFCAPMGTARGESCVVIFGM